VIKKRLDLTDNNPEQLNLDELAKEYSFSQKAQRLAQEAQEEEITESDEGLDSGEDEMAAALAAAEDGDSDSENTQDSSEDATEDQIVIIEQKKPLLPPEQIVNGTSFLSEINIEEMFFFSGKEFLMGQSIVIQFNIPRKFIINATVFYCRLYNMKSRVISSNPLPYRIGVKFLLNKEGERTILREFLHSIEPDLENFTVNTTADSEDDDDDDILDGLDDDI
jgi:hypothetical protein